MHEIFAQRSARIAKAQIGDWQLSSRENAELGSFGEMMRVVAFFKNRSLSLSLVLLVLCLPLLGCLGGPLDSWHDRTFLIETGAVVFCLFAVWCAALINLIKDADRGYSPSRCSLASVIMLFAVAPLAVVGYQVLWAAVHLK